MLSIDVVNTQELIHYLTPRKGILEDDVYLITVTKPNDMVIIPSKDKIYSEQFTEDTFNPAQAQRLVRFIEHLLDHVQTMWDQDYKLIIHSYDKNGIARAIADYFFATFPESDINKLYYDTFDLAKDRDEEVVKIVFTKLYTLKEYFLAFGLDF